MKDGGALGDAGVEEKWVRGGTFHGGGGSIIATGESDGNAWLSKRTQMEGPTHDVQRY